jgi:CBS domain-containing protein
MCKVKEILQEKGNAVYSVAPDAAVLDALRLMAKQNIGVVLVVDDPRILGIFSERDCVSDLASDDSLYLQAPVKDYMTSPVYFVTPDQTMEDCMAVMTAKNIRHLPVLEDEKLIGMISIGDVVRTIVSERDASIHDLENFLWVNLI